MTKSADRARRNAQQQASFLRFNRSVVRPGAWLLSCLQRNVLFDALCLMSGHCIR